MAAWPLEGSRSSRPLDLRAATAQALNGILIGPPVPGDVGGWGG